jgi:hypothetical protein
MQVFARRAIRCMLEVLWTTRIVPMIGRWEITDEQWCLLGRVNTN